MICSAIGSKGDLANSGEVKRSRRELVIRINTGGRGEIGEIKLTDITNTNYINYQIKDFIRSKGLKETAFAYIKDIILKKIAQKKEEIYLESHSKCSRNCKCSSKLHHFEEKEKLILGAIAVENNCKQPDAKVRGRK